LIDPQTQDRIYDKTNTNSTIWYVNAQIIYEKRMNDLLWLVNHPLRDNVVGIPTSQNHDRPQGLESQVSIGIRKIPAKLPHSTKPELRKLHRTRTDSGRASALELLRGLLTCREVLRPTEPHSLHTFCRGEHHGIYRRSKTVLWPKIGCVGPTCQAGRPSNLVV
jgi:hypothetical protein